MPAQPVDLVPKTDLDAAVTERDQLRVDREKLRSALVSMVGLDGERDLERMEVTLRSSPIPLKERASMLDAVHALQATLPTKEKTPLASSVED